MNIDGTFTIIDALNSIAIDKYEYADSNGKIIWKEGVTSPSQAEIDAEIQRLQAEYDNAQYSRDRAEAYPSIEDQLDKIYHDGIDAWKADIKAVKDEYPKP